MVMADRTFIFSLILAYHFMLAGPAIENWLERI